MCGRVVSALTSDELLRIAKAKQIYNSLKYKSSYNIGPERHLAGILMKNTNKVKHYEANELDTPENQQDYSGNENRITTTEEKINNISQTQKKSINIEEEAVTNNSEDEKENFFLNKIYVREKEIIQSEE